MSQHENCSGCFLCAATKTTVIATKATIIIGKAALGTSGTVINRIKSTVPRRIIQFTVDQSNQLAAGFSTNRQLNTDADAKTDATAKPAER